MDKRTMVLVASLVTTLGEVKSGGVPSGLLYAGVMSQGYSLADYQGVVDMLTAAGLVEVDRFFLVNVTESGRALADRINGALAAAGRAS